MYGDKIREILEERGRNTIHLTNDDLEKMFNQVVSSCPEDRKIMKEVITIVEDSTPERQIEGLLDVISDVLYRVGEELDDEVRQKWSELSDLPHTKKVRQMSQYVTERNKR